MSGQTPSIVKILCGAALVFLSIGGCTYKRDAGNKILTIDLQEPRKEVDAILYSNFCTEVSFTVLQPHNDWYFPKNRLPFKVLDKYILFLNRGRSEYAIGIFDRNGEFKLKLNHRGKGPGEYITIQDYGMNPNETKIWILERTSGRIHWYDLNGNWTETIKIPTVISYLRILENGNMIAQNRRWDPDKFDENRLLLFDQKGNFLQSVWDKSKEQSDFDNYRDENWMFESSQTLFYRDTQFSDTLFRLTKKLEPEPYLILNNLPETADPASAPQRGPESSASVKINNFLILNNFILVSGRKEKALFYQVNRTTQEVVYSEKLTDDLLGLHAAFDGVTENSSHMMQLIFLDVYRENPDILFQTDKPVNPAVQARLRQAIKEADDEVQVILVFYKVNAQ